GESDVCEQNDRGSHLPWRDRRPADRVGRAASVVRTGLRGRRRRGGHDRAERLPALLDAGPDRNHQREDPNARLKASRQVLDQRCAMNCFTHGRVAAVGLCGVCQKAVCHEYVARDTPRLICRACAARGSLLPYGWYGGYGYSYEYRSSTTIGGWPLL